MRSLQTAGTKHAAGYLLLVVSGFPWRPVHEKAAVCLFHSLKGTVSSGGRGRVGE